MSVPLIGTLLQVASAAAADSYNCSTVEASAVYNDDYIRKSEIEDVKESTFQFIEGDGYIIVLRTYKSGKINPTKLTTKVNTDGKLIAASVNFFGTDTLVFSTLTSSDQSATLSLQTSSNAVTWRLVCNRSN